MKRSGWGGVARYDGVAWQTFTTKNGLADKRILAIAQDAKGNLWFGIVSGLSRYDGTTWQTFNIIDGR